MSFLDDVEYVGHSRSFWNYFVETGELRNRDPGHDSEIRQARRDGLVWEVENAGTDVYLWRRECQNGLTWIRTDEGRDEDCQVIVLTS